MITYCGRIRLFLTITIFGDLYSVFTQFLHLKIPTKTGLVCFTAFMGIRMKWYDIFSHLWNSYFLSYKNRFFPIEKLLLYEKKPVNSKHSKGGCNRDGIEGLQLGRCGKLNLPTTASCGVPQYTRYFLSLEYCGLCIVATINSCRCTQAWM